MKTRRRFSAGLALGLLAGLWVSEGPVMAQRVPAQVRVAAEGVPASGIQPSAAAAFVDEVEPNNQRADAQRLSGPSPVTLDGLAEVADVGELEVTFSNGQADDIEDLYVITTAQAGLRLTLNRFTSDCDLYVLAPDTDSTLTVQGFSISVGSTAPETIDLTSLVPGTYFIGVAIFDLAPQGGASTTYQLTIENNTLTATEGAGGVPAAFALEPNYPNPFNPETRIGYEVPAGGAVRLAVYDVQGRQVRMLVDAVRPAGTHAVTWDGRTDAGLAAPSGMYFYRLQAGSIVQSRTLVLLR